MPKVTLTSDGSPRYMSPTRSLARQHRSLEEDAVALAFTPGNFQAIRTLPKIKPGFKPSPQTQRAMMNSPRRSTLSLNSMTNAELWEMYHDEKTHESKNRGVTHPGRGQNAPSSFSPRNRSVFSDFQWVPSEYDREKQLKAADLRKRRERNICVEDFKNFSMPETIKGTGTFREFEYTIDPFETRDVLASIEQRDRAGMQMGPAFKPGGKNGTDPLDKQRGRLEEAINTMASKLVRDWPTCLRGLEIVNDGFVVVAFDRHTQQKEGNIHAYMNNFMQTDETVLTFGLKRDASRWGDQAEGFLQYVIQPRWVRLKATAAWYNLHPGDQTFSPKMFRRTAK